MSKQIAPDTESLSRKRPRIREAIVVEGRYDKNALAQVVDAPIFVLNGFSVFHDRRMTTYLRQVAEERGIVVFTDSDGAGFVLRNHLKSVLPPGTLKHAYIPAVAGKERRKRAPGKAGLLGVEGMRPAVLLDALRRAGATFLDEDTDSIIGSAAVNDRTPVTKADFFDWGLSGGPDSAARRCALCRRLDLPEHLSANALLEAVNLLYSRDALEAVLNMGGEDHP